MFCQGVAVALHPGSCYADSRTAQMRNSTAPLLNQMSRGQLTDGMVVRTHEASLHPGNGAVNQDEWSFALHDVLERAGSRLRRCQDQPVHLTGQERLGFILFQLRILFKIRDDDVIAVRPHRVSDCLGDLREKRVGKIRQQQSDGEGSPGYQAARDPVGLIIELLGSLQDTLPGSGADLALVAQDLGHRDHGNIQSPGNVLHGNGHRREGYHLRPIWREGRFGSS